jgi:glycerol-3-phosphate cytidylyltransferase
VSKVLTVGTFDLPHTGHLRLFSKCRKLADLLTEDESKWNYMEAGTIVLGRKGQVIIGLNSDTFVYRYKGKFPIYRYEERYKILSEFKDVDRVIINDEYTLQSMLAKEKPDFLVVGSDWASKDYYKQIGVTEQWLDQHKITLCYVEYTQGVSTTQLKERISAS